jgi:hypothetical protein
MPGHKEGEKKWRLFQPPLAVKSQRAHFYQSINNIADLSNGAWNGRIPVRHDTGMC